jgi:hypothetical protein
MSNLITFAPTGARLLLGLIFVVFGLNYFLGFLPVPPAEGDAATFKIGLAATGYFFPMMKSIQIAVGLALLANRYVALALVVLAPITVNILAYHVIDPAGLPMALVILALHLTVAWSRREAYAPLLKAEVAT